METKKGEKEYTKKEYICGYCGFTHIAYVRKVLGSYELGMKKDTPKHNVSTQVQCPYCYNFLKTWTEGKDIEVLKHRPITPYKRRKMNYYD